MKDSGPQPFKGGHEGNLKYVDYDPDKVRKLAALAYDLDVLIEIGGIPFGKAQHHRLKGHDAA